MRKIFIIVLLACIPLSGIAQQFKRSGPVRSAGDFFGISPDVVLMVGVGSLGGAIAVNALLGSAGSAVLGGVAGGVLGNWWMRQKPSTDGIRAAWTSPSHHTTTNGASPIPGSVAGGALGNGGMRQPPAVDQAPADLAKPLLPATKLAAQL